MDLSCVISSGDLELYVLGLLPEEQAYKVEQLALLFPEIKEEIDRISKTLEDLANTASTLPSPGVKTRVMDKLKALKAQEPLTNPSEPLVVPVSANGAKTAAPVIPLAPRVRRRQQWLGAAAIIGILITTGLCVYLSQQNRQQRQEVAQLQHQVDTLQKSWSFQQQQLLASNQALQIFQNNDYQRIDLINVPGKPAALAHLFWNKKTQEVYISDMSLPQAPVGKQYQLWAIVNGQPVDAGLLNSQKNYLQKMKAFAAADAFAITLEKQGGSPTPTLEEMYVMGKTS